MEFYHPQNYHFYWWDSKIIPKFGRFMAARVANIKFGLNEQNFWCVRDHCHRPGFQNALLLWMFRMFGKSGHIWYPGI
jgi:hypothetical protein